MDGSPGLTRWPVASVVSLLAAAAACAPPGRGGNGGGAGAEGGNRGSGAQGGGGGAGGGPGAGSCKPGERVCDGVRVRECGPSGKLDGPVVEECAAGACSMGGCTSAACAAAEKRQTFIGCRFYWADTDNLDYDDKLESSIVVGNVDASLPASVRLETRAVGGGFTTMMAATLMPGETKLFPLGDRHGEGTGLFAALAYRVSSDVPLAAYAWNSDDQQGKGRENWAESTGATILLPAHVLGRRHMAMGLPGPPTSQTDGEHQPSTFAVIAAADGTSVTVTPAAAVKAGMGIGAVGKGGTLTAVLDEGDVLQIEDAAPGQDLTGTEISSSRPVAVLSGNSCAADGAGWRYKAAACDMTQEQLIPVEAWGKSYVASRLLNGPYVPPSPCQPDKQAKTRWRILASEPGTTITFDAPTETTGLPAGSVTLDRGQILELSVGGEKLPSWGGGGSPWPPVKPLGDFFVSASKPILLAQFMPCEMSMGSPYRPSSSSTTSSSSRRPSTKPRSPSPARPVARPRSTGCRSRTACSCRPEEGSRSPASTSRNTRSPNASRRLSPARTGSRAPPSASRCAATTTSAPTSMPAAWASAASTARQDAFEGPDAGRDGDRRPGRVRR